MNKLTSEYDLTFQAMEEKINAQCDKIEILKSALKEAEEFIACVADHTKPFPTRTSATAVLASIALANTRFQ